MRILLTLFTVFLFSVTVWADTLPRWTQDCPGTDFTKSNISIAEIISGGPPRDGIPSIDDPQFKSASDDLDITGTEPVISIEVNGEDRTYPVRILMWHEIVNDVAGGEPVTVTYCPLCNASVVFDRRLDGKVLDFGTSGMLRYSDMIMYDRQTDSLWQQFTGEAVIGDLAGQELTILPSRTESIAVFTARHPAGKVLVPPTNTRRRYGTNPYRGYDTTKAPFLYDGKYTGNVPALSRVVAVDKHAWPLSVLRKKKTITSGDLTLTWSKGQNSALDSAKIRNGRDVGNLTVTRAGKDAVHHIPFAFAFMAFHPDGVIHEK